MSQEWTRDDLLILGRGFMVPRILLTAAELDLFTKLKGKALSVDELCSTEGWDRTGINYPDGCARSGRPVISRA